MSHEVNNTVAASNSLLHSSLAYAGDLDAGNRHDFEQAIGIVIERTEQLAASCALRRRLPAAAAADQAAATCCRFCRACRGCSRANEHARADHLAWEVATVVPGRRRPRPDRTGAAQHPQERGRGHRRRRHGDGPADASGSRPTLTIDDTGPGNHGRSAVEPVHAVLQHQAARPGHRPHAGSGDPQPPTDSTTASNGRHRARLASPW